MIKKALIIGIDDYPSAPLNGCVNDAESVSQLLETNGDGSPNFDISLNLNVKDKNTMISLLKALFKGSSDIALLYFSGHGSESQGGQIVTPDYVGDDLGVPMNTILGMANNSNCKNVIIILDCCFAGNLGESYTTGGTESHLGEGVTIMTASPRDDVAIESKGQGVFTSLLIQGLNGGASDITGKITPASLYSFIDQSLGAWEPRPIFKTNISSFLPIRTIEPKVSITTLRKLSQYFPNQSDELDLDPSFEYTNSHDIEHEVIEPYATQKNVNIFRDLQLFESVGLIEPVGENHMYFAAMHSKSCKLTALGLHYWRLSKDRRF
ncbi:TPA_asm: caspase family protein [Listeria monocytogenes]|uniref:Caspase family protein n=1 Tax=Listeria innocua TaxID=1642 RepID=A0AB73HAZ9_LISIO|nr:MULTISPECIES: caspase family protein [Listeria]EAC9724934.1 caspase family protein [Listeria monocytogenes]EAD8348978.1 caspase family protein [Listeria monocytogenes]EAD8394919.1 caspase family protein [Listeria monocytogenes]EAF3882312.1 caspase family protein [Listeria monocytogenes]MBC2143375.1 caspase family protein [Listeria innocua]